MKTIYKAIFLLLLVNLLMFISTACWKKCGKDYDFQITSIQGSAVIVWVDSSNISNIKNETAVYQGQPIRYDSVGFDLKSTYITITQNTSEPTVFSIAQACQPISIYAKIYSLKITSNKNYNSQYPAGNDLKAMMEISNDNLKAQPANSWQYINRDITYILKPIVPPSNSDKHDFTLTFNLEKGGTIVTQINNVFITK